MIAFLVSIRPKLLEKSTDGTTYTLKVLWLGKVRILKIKDKRAY